MTTAVNWFRSYGNENWEFAPDGLMQRRFASINDLPINESERKYHWPLGRRPDDHPSLSDLGLEHRGLYPAAAASELTANRQYAREIALRSTILASRPLLPRRDLLHSLLPRRLPLRHLRSRRTWG